MKAPLSVLASSALGMLVVSASSALCQAQVVPPIPPAPTPAPEYVPPPPLPKPVETKPPEVEPAAPSLVKTDSAGKFVAIQGSAEMAAIASYPFNAERRSKVDSTLAARAGEAERFAAENPGKVGAALKARRELEGMSDFNQLYRAKEAAAPLKQENLIDRLQRDGAITPMQSSRLQQMISEYAEARRKDAETRTGADVMKIAQFIGKQGFEDIAGEVLAAADRVALRAAAIVIEGSHGVPLDESAQAAVSGFKAVPRESSSQIIEAARALLFEQLPAETSKAILAKVLPTSGK